MRKIIYYLSNRDLTKGKSDCISTMRTCSSLKKCGFDARVIAHKRHHPQSVAKDQMWEYYGLPENDFNVVVLPTRLGDNSSTLRTRVEKLFWHLVFSIRVFWDCMCLPKGTVTIISRCLVSTYPYIFVLWPIRKLKRIHFVFELHYYENTGRYNYVLSKMDGLICITNSLREKVAKVIECKAGRIVTARMGVDVSVYQGMTDTKRLRKQVDFPADDWIVLYTGKVFKTSKEIELILQAAGQLQGVKCVFVGGKPDAVDYWDNYCKSYNILNAVFTGYVMPSYISTYQCAADALVMYYDSGIMTADCTSPSKMMEYMAAGKPIISVDLPVLREVLRDSENALLVQPNSPSKLAEAIVRLQGDKTLAVRLGMQAATEAVSYSWENRGRVIAALVEKLS